MKGLSYIKNFIRTVIVIILLGYFGIITLLSIPAVQRKVTAIAESELSQLFATEVRIEKIDLGLLNRVIIENMLVKDRTGLDMLKIARFSAKIDIQPLFQRKISINSVQLFGLNASLNKAVPQAQPNFQFIIDTFAPKDSVKKEFNLDLRINSILIRRGSIRYDLLSVPETPGRFNANHLGIENLSATLSLKALSKDTLNAQIKRFTLQEKSGFLVKKLVCKVTANRQGIQVSEFGINLPQSFLKSETLYLRNSKRLDFIHLNEDIRYKGNLNSTIALSDLSPFAPILKNFNEKIHLRFDAEGQGTRLHLNDFSFYNTSRDINIAAKGHIDGSTSLTNPFISGKLSEATISQSGIRMIYHNLLGKENIPPVIENVGFVDFKGNINGQLRQLTTRGVLKAAPGAVNASVTMTRDSISGMRSFSGHVSTDGLNIGMLLPKDKKAGITVFDLDITGLSSNNGYTTSYLKGMVSQFEYNNYKYQNILLDGQYESGGFTGRIAMDDANGKIDVNGQFSTRGIPYFNLTAQLSDFNPNALHLTPKYKDTHMSMLLTANFSGRSLNEVKGYISLDSLHVVAPLKEMSYSMDRFNIIADSEGERKEIQIHSPFFHGSINGYYSYKTIFASLTKVVSNYLPSLLPPQENPIETTNQFQFNFRMEDSEIFQKVLGIPLNLKMPATLSGSFNDKDQQLYLNGSFPQLTFKNNLYESGSLIVANNNNSLQCNLRANTMMKKGSMMNISLAANARNDSLISSVFWGNNTSITYSGELHTLTRFSRNTDKKINTEVRIRPSQVILNDTVWALHDTRISIQKDSIHINNFLFNHANQHIHINGCIGKQTSDSCLVNLNNINVKYIMDMIQFHAVKFSGNASGKASLKHVLATPDISMQLNVGNFHLNDALLGQADIKGGFDIEKGAILLDADIHEDQDRFTKVKGFISPKHKGLDLDIQAGGTNLGFIGHFVRNIFSEVNGRAYGRVRLFGPFRGLDLEGQAKAEMEMKVNILNTKFKLSAEKVNIKSGLFQFNNVKMSDSEGNTGLANGELHHKKMKELKYNFRFDTNNMLVFKYDQTTPEFPFYGNIYTSGNVLIKGAEGMLTVDGHMKASDKTIFTYVLGTASAATNNQFITFVDKTPKRIQEEVKTDLYHYLNQPSAQTASTNPLDVFINLQIEPTPQATMKILMDEASGDNITAKGTGNLRINFYNKGNFQIFGNYIVSDGFYKMSMQNIIRREFILQPGGTVSFNGDPRTANLDVQAVYTVASASIDDLLPNASSSEGNVKVNCLLNLTGELTSPSLKFDLDLPTVNDEDRELVRSLTSTEEQMNTQIIYLLSIGKFYPFDYANGSQSNATSALAFSTLSGQLNNMLAQVVNNQNWNIGTNLSTGEGWTDVEAEAILSGRMLNNRLIINGNFGYKNNTLRNTNFVGDFEAIWLLTKNGDLRIRGYNQTNDRYFTKSTMTTQGVGLMYKKDFTHWKELFNWILFRKHRKERQEKKQQIETPASVDR